MPFLLFPIYIYIFSLFSAHVVRKGVQLYNTAKPVSKRKKINKDMHVLQSE